MLGEGLRQWAAWQKMATAVLRQVVAASFICAGSPEDGGGWWQHALWHMKSRSCSSVVMLKSVMSCGGVEVDDGKLGIAVRSVQSRRRSASGEAHGVVRRGASCTRKARMENPRTPRFTFATIDADDR